MSNNLIDTSFTFRVQALAVLGSVLLLLFIIHLIKKEYLREGYSLLWFFIAIVLLVFSVFSNLLFKFSDLIGIYYAPMTLVLIFLFGLILIVIHFSVLISRYEKQIKELSQEVGLLKNKLEKHTKTK